MRRQLFNVSHFSHAVLFIIKAFGFLQSPNAFPEPVSVFLEPENRKKYKKFGKGACINVKNGVKCIVIVYSIFLLQKDFTETGVLICC